MLDQETLSQVISVAFSGVSLLGIWFLLFWLYPDYRLDAFRSEMFSLRDKLFDDASSGKISFSHPAYQMLRNTMNGYLRSAQRLTPLRFMLTTRELLRDDRKNKYSFEKEWQKNIIDLPPGTVTLLVEYRRNMHSLVIQQTIKSSPLFIITVIPVVMTTISIWFQIRILRNMFAHIVQLLDKRLAALNSVAFKEGNFSATK